ncbi:MAG: protein translocase subunit SecD [Patescibacteria group bacterium]|nr:protein translocase subunit SecD [Patescibacteria group bacterium]
MNVKTKRWLKPLIIIVLVVTVGIIANPKPTGIGWLDGLVGTMKINMGLDLQGGVHLVYEADMTNIEDGKESEALSGIQDVIERRVNAFGVAEPVIQPSKVGGSYRLIVELAGVKDIEEAKGMIKETPFLEFREEGQQKEQLDEEQQKIVDEQVESAKKTFEEKKIQAQEILDKVLAGEDFDAIAKESSEDPGSGEKGGDLDFFKKGVMVGAFEDVVFSDELQVGQIHPEIVESDFGFHIIKKIDQRGEGDDKEIRASHILLSAPNPEGLGKSMAAQLMKSTFEPSGLTGKELERSQVNFNQQTGQPEVLLQFNDDGKKMFKEITERSIGKQVAIYLDGNIISAPVVNDVIRDGNAVISGGFNLKEAQELAQRLNAGALPVPIKLISQQSVEASLGKASLDTSLKAGLWGLIAVGIFMILYYRLAGVVAVVALSVYALLMVSIFKISSLSQTFAITLTLSGIAGFILSVGMAVDANILILERMKEEIKRGRDLKSALDAGFRRAWTSIRDGNFSTILTCLILMTFGTGFIKGFAITLVIGVLLSMFTAIVITRVLLGSILSRWFEGHKWLVIVGERKNLEEKSQE